MIKFNSPEYRELHLYDLMYTEFIMALMDNDYFLTVDGKTDYSIGFDMFRDAIKKYLDPEVKEHIKQDNYDISKRN